MYFVYILKNNKNKLHVEISSQLQEKLFRHKIGDGAEFTKRNKNFKLVYQENYATLIEARRREKQIKGWRREKKRKSIKLGRPTI